MSSCAGKRRHGTVRARWPFGAAIACAYAATLPPAAVAQDRPDHFAAWVAVAEPAHDDIRIAENQWAPVLRFRPDRVFKLDEAAVEATGGKTLLAAGTLMIGMVDRPGLACELERPRGAHLVGCVEDKDGDGRFETFFDLNHNNPYLFSAFRQPRSKDRPVRPLSLSPTAPQLDGGEPVSMVLFYRGHAALRGASAFELCVLRPDNRNLWGDKTVARGCLPMITIGDADYPRKLSIYGRTLTFVSRDAEGVTVSVTGATTDTPARL